MHVVRTKTTTTRRASMKSEVNLKYLKHGKLHQYSCSRLGHCSCSISRAKATLCVGHLWKLENLKCNVKTSNWWSKRLSRTTNNGCAYPIQGEKSLLGTAYRISQDEIETITSVIDQMAKFNFKWFLLPSSCHEVHWKRRRQQIYPAKVE